MYLLSLSIKLVYLSDQSEEVAAIFAISHAYKQKKNWAPPNSIRQVNGASVTTVEEVGQPMTDAQIMESVFPKVFSYLDH